LSFDFDENGLIAFSSRFSFFFGAKLELPVVHNYQLPHGPQDYPGSGYAKITDSDEPVHCPVARGCVVCEFSRRVIAQPVAGIETTQQNRLALIAIPHVLLKVSRVGMSGKGNHGEKNRGQQLRAEHDRIF
jgi:hypothetical protein